MTQKKQNPKQGIQPIFICSKIDSRHQADLKRGLLALFFLLACLKIFCGKTTERNGVTTTVRCRLRRICRLLPRR